MIKFSHGKQSLVITAHFYGGFFKKLAIMMITAGITILALTKFGPHKEEPIQPRKIEKNIVDSIAYDELEKETW